MIQVLYTLTIGRKDIVCINIGRKDAVYIHIGRKDAVSIHVGREDTAYRYCVIQRMCNVYTVESGQLVLACRRAYLLRSEAHNLRFCPIFAPYVSSRSLPVGIQSLWLEVWATRSRDHNYT